MNIHNIGKVDSKSNKTKTITNISEISQQEVMISRNIKKKYQLSSRIDYKASLSGDNQCDHLGDDIGKYPGRDSDKNPGKDLNKNSGSSKDIESVKPLAYTIEIVDQDDNQKQITQTQTQTQDKKVDNKFMIYLKKLFHKLEQ